MAAKDDVLKQLTSLKVHLDQTSTPGSTTITAAAGKAAVTLTVAAITNFTAGDTIRIGSGDEMEVAVISGAPAGLVITIAEGLQYAHAIAEPVVEMVTYDLGPIGVDGVSFTANGESVEVPVSTSRMPLATLLGFVDLALGATLPTFTPEMYAIAVGALQSYVKGAGTAVSPKSLTLTGAEFGSQSNIGVTAEGVTFGGGIVRIDLWGCTADYTGVSLTLSRGQVVGLPCSWVGARGAVSSTAFPGTSDISIRPAKANVWDALTQVGYFVDTATTTTVAVGAVAVDAVLINFTSATSFANDEWFRIGLGSDAQFFQVASKSTNAVTTKTPVKSAIANGATITKVTATDLGRPSAAGVTLATGGQTTPIRSATSRPSLGLRLGSSSIQLSLGLIAWSLTNFARMFGIPAADIVSNRMTLNNIGTVGIDGLYLTGITKGGLIQTIVVTGSDIDPSGLSLTMNNTGDASPLPINAKPTGYVQLQQY